MNAQLFALVTALIIVGAPLAAAQTSRVPARPLANTDVSNYASPEFMQILMTGGFQELEKTGRSNGERSRIRGYLYGLFQAVSDFFIPPGKFDSVAAECRAMSFDMGDEQLYLNGWIRDYVKNFQLGILKSATLPGALGTRSVAAGQAEFGDMQDIIQDGKTDGTRLAKTLKGCDDPTVKTVVQNARIIHYKYPSSGDVVPSVAVMPTQSDLQALAGQYSVERSTSVVERSTSGRDNVTVAFVTGNVTVAVSGSNLTLTDSRGRSFELRPTSPMGFVIAGTPQGKVTFNQNRLAFNRGDVVFIASRLDAQLDPQSPAGQYQSLVGEYSVISNIPRNLNLAVDVSSGMVLTVAVRDGNLTLTNSQGRSYELQPTGNTNEFLIAGTPQAVISFLPSGPFIYREGKSKFSATRVLSGRAPRR